MVRMMMGIKMRIKKVHVILLYHLKQLEFVSHLKKKSEKKQTNQDQTSHEGHTQHYALHDIKC